MYRCNFPKIASVAFNIMALLTVISHSAQAQHPINFVEPNQSRQFFEEGNEIIEDEIKWLQQDRQLPKIELPEDRYQPQAFAHPNYIDRHLTLKPISEAEIDNEQ